MVSFVHFSFFIYKISLLLAVSIISYKYFVLPRFNDLAIVLCTDKRSPVLRDYQICICIRSICTYASAIGVVLHPKAHVQWSGVNVEDSFNVWLLALPSFVLSTTFTDTDLVHAWKYCSMWIAPWNCYSMEITFQPSCALRCQFCCQYCAWKYCRLVHIKYGTSSYQPGGMCVWLEFVSFLSPFPLLFSFLLVSLSLSITHSFSLSLTLSL